MGSLVAVSGLDGAGKTTLIKRVVEHLSQEFKQPRFISVRLGFTPILRAIKIQSGYKQKNRATKISAKQNSGANKNGKKWLFYKLFSMIDLMILFAAIRLFRLWPRPIVCDRYYWDNWIIFLEKYGQPKGLFLLLWRLIHILAGQPTVSILLVLPPEESFRRMTGREGFIQESLETLTHRYDLYASLPKTGMHQIDATSSPEEVFHTARRYIQAAITD